MFHLMMDYVLCLCMCLNELMSVSYTHLDVYKRQELGLCIEEQTFAKSIN